MGIVTLPMWLLWVGSLCFEHPKKGKQKDWANFWGNLENNEKTGSQILSAHGT